METPWGHADTVNEIAPGITWVTTPSHGGIVLSDDRSKELYAKFPTFRSWTGPYALEEDCDWAIAPFVWPDLFNQADRDAALRTLIASHKEVLYQF